MRFFRALCITTQWMVALSPLGSLCWFLLLAQWIKSESGRWPPTFLDDPEHYGYDNAFFDYLFHFTYLSALLTLMCGLFLLPAITSLWTFNLSSIYRRKWFAAATLSWATLLFAPIREFYTILTG